MENNFIKNDKLISKLPLFYNFVKYAKNNKNTVIIDTTFRLKSIDRLKSNYTPDTPRIILYEK